MLTNSKILFVCLLFTFSKIQAQQYDTKLRISKGISLRIGNANFSYSKLTSTNSLEKNEPVRLTFLEQTVGFNYFFKNCRIGVSHNPIIIFRATKSNYWKHRFQLSSAIRNEIGKVRFFNTLAIEYFSKQETKYRARLIYTLKAQSKKRKKLGKHLKVAPYIACRIYYNIGGEPIKQYQISNEIVEEKVPYGFHRARVYLGLSSRIKSSCFLSFYSIFQQEFNTYFSRNHAINILNPETGKINRPFNNYIAVGASFRYILRLKTKQQKDTESDLQSKYQ